MTGHEIERLRDDDVVLDALPDEVQASIEVRDAWFARLPRNGGGEEFFVADLQRWTPGKTLKVAFLGGSKTLHQEIAEATKQIQESCNLKLDFGRDPATGNYRTWSEQDQTHRADIRVSFDQGGYFSLVGTDSIDTTLSDPSYPVGGGPGQRSLNLGGFHVRKPANWQGVVRHEFLHALAFKHSHQNMRGPCEDQLRWDDDPGYEPTTDADGRYVPDAAGRRPGIYTYLAGFPNRWTKSKVDHNLRTKEDPNAVAGPFDQQSVMLYRFDAFFYKTNPSPCAPTGDGLALSDGDKRGLRLLYPEFGPNLSSLESHREALLEVLQPRNEAMSGLESARVVAQSSFGVQAVKVLSQGLNDLRAISAGR
jgi:hypothetical protein